ncbi:MAG: HYExAFE family protein [Planctomycetes bacterium]|nr:HYExAFE family protein [Planctomycetota bacterium]
MKASIHYEAAFEDFLRVRQIPYVAVDEAKRAAFRDAKLKSFDFIVYSRRETNWLADIKGRRWASRASGARPIWENWVTQADLDGLSQWQEVFGQGFRALFVFAYWLADGHQPPEEVLHVFRDQRYVFAAVRLDDYVLGARVRSPKWGTVNLPTAEFARLVKPVEHWL